jgi:hypothetical protein
MLRTSKRVRVGTVAFEPTSKPQAGIFALESIEKDTFIWEINGVLSEDLLEGASVSAMVAHPIQGMKKGVRLLVGPARIMNHCCSPNVRVCTSPLVDGLSG